MAETGILAAAADGGDHGNGTYRLRSDGGSSIIGYLGDFTKGPAIFTLYTLGPDQGCYPNGPTRYLIDVDDGAGARECCRFTADPTESPIWNGCWNNDEWCSWILEQAHALIADKDE